jgi:hypothetical protein
MQVVHQSDKPAVYIEARALTVPTGAPDQGCLGFVLRTGFASSQGW